MNLAEWTGVESFDQIQHDFACMNSNQTIYKVIKNQLKDGDKLDLENIEFVNDDVSFKVNTLDVGNYTIVTHQFEKKFC